MRRLASFLLLGVALAAGATEIWRWKDADGVMHYSDSPVAGAERVSAGPAPQSGARTVASPQAASTPPATVLEPTVRYTHCAVTLPTNDMVFFGVDSIDAAVTIEPPLQRGHRIQIWLNGGVFTDWPDTATGFKLTGLYRGSYTLAVKVIDDNDRTVCAGPAINFHIRQPSALSPARQPPRKK